MTDGASAAPSTHVPLDGAEHGLGFTASLGLVLTAWSGDEVAGFADVGPEHFQETGIVHGGWHAAVVETIGSLGAHAARPDDGTVVVGVSNFTEFFRAHREGRLTVRGVPVHRGRTQQVWEVRISRAADEALVARGQLRLQHVEPR